MQKFSFLTSLVIGIMTCGVLSSCEKDDPVVVNDNQQSTTNSTTTTPTSVSFSDKNDPDGTIWLNVDNQEYRIKSGAYDILVNWRSPNNFVVDGISYTSRDVMIVRVGKISGLKDINTNQIPNEGWASIMSCEPGYGYIVRYNYMYTSEDSTTYYYAICVVDNLYGVESGGICGAKIKYCPFSPTGGWNN